MTRFKVIPLPFYHIADNREEFLMHGKGILESYSVMDPIFNRPGMYLDRSILVAWIETKFGSWRIPESTFHEHLHYISNDERILHPKVVKSMRQIQNSGMKIKELNHLLYDHDCAAMLRHTYRSAKKWRIRILQPGHCGPDVEMV